MKAASAMHMPVRVLSVVLVAAFTGPAGADELADLKAEAAELGARIARLEAGTGGEGADQAVPAWVRRITFSGDLRYRNETTEQELLDRRNRDRLRVRAGFTVQVNDAVQAGIALATSEGNDPRSSNVTLGHGSSRKDFYLDRAYVQWQALPSVALLAGKMKYPWQRAGASGLFDDDVNPEGLAVTWQQGDFFGSGFHYFIDERADASESTLQGAQLGWEPSMGAGQLQLAASYFDFHRVRGRNPFHSGNAFGNTTTAVDCHGGAASCLAHDYDLVEVQVELSHPVAGRRLQVFADYIRNIDADSDSDAAFTAGITYGRAADPRTWEIGYGFQRVEKDAVFAQFVDSDIGAGNTDHRAHLVRAAYAVASNWVINATWQIAETDLDVPASVDGGLLHGRDYQRLQFDLNFRF